MNFEASNFDVAAIEDNLTYGRHQHEPTRRLAISKCALALHKAPPISIITGKLHECVTKSAVSVTVTLFSLYDFVLFLLQ